MIERQNVIAAVAVLVLFGVAAWLRPDPPPSFHAEFARVAAAERELLDRYTAASRDFKAGQTTTRRLPTSSSARSLERERC